MFFSRFCSPSLIYFLSCLAVLASGCGRSERADDWATPHAGDLPTGTAVIEFVMPDERVIRRSVPVTPGSTLEKVLRQIESPEIEITGSEVTAFVQSIGGMPTGSDRGWTFTVDGEFAQEGIGSTPISPGQTVVWKFTTFEEAVAP